VTPPSPAIPAPPTSAALAISGFTVTVYPPTTPESPFYFYDKFHLTETSGKSGATIQEIRTSIDDGGGGGDATGPVCWRETIRVEPGASLNAFDESWDPRDYCAPFTASRVSGPHVIYLIVTFKDDDGHDGTVRATTTVPK
jgi:hypothetical protein